MKIKEFTIDRAKWYRGKGPITSRLLTDDGKMCCLGFFAKACGIADVDIINRSVPAVVKLEKIPEDWGRVLLDGNSVDGSSFTTHTLMITNDYIHHTDKVREEKIVAEFAYHGITVKFVG